MGILAVFKLALDLLFPCNCYGCGKTGSYCCRACEDALLLAIKKPPKLQSKIHLEDCYFEDVLVCADYDDCELLKKLIWQFKYKYSQSLVNLLSKVLLAKLKNIHGESFLVPIPLSPKKHLMRGFDQSFLLAKYLELKSPRLHLLDCLIRSDGRKDQAKLNRSDRLTNLVGAFSIKQEFEQKIRGQNIILLDDVMTTGATLNECAKVLKSNAGCNVYGLVLMRAL